MKQESRCCWRQLERVEWSLHLLTVFSFFQSRVTIKEMVRKLLDELLSILKNISRKSVEIALELVHRK